MICIMLITIVNLLYSIFYNTGRVRYDVIPGIEERKYEELFDLSSDLLSTNVISQVENSPVKVNIAKKSTNKKNGMNLKIFSLLRLV